MNGASTQADINRINVTLPDGWRWVRLGDHVTKIGSGITPRGGQASYLRSGIPLIRSQNVHMNRFEPRGLAFISAQQDEEMEASRTQEGDVLLNITGASIGRVCVIPSELCPANVNQHVTIIRGDGSFVSEFLSFFISTPDFQKSILDSQAGATRQALTKSLIENFRIPLPPFSEQKRIALILKEQMIAVERARIAAEAQLESINALPAAYLRAVFTGTKVVGGGQRKRLGEILQLRKEVIHPRDNPKGSAVFVGLEHIESVTGRRLGSVKIEMSELSGRKPQFYKGDIVYGYLRPYLNKIWVADFDGLCSVDQYVYSVSNDMADTNFVAWFMRSPIYLARAPINTTPGQLPRIRTEEVAAVEIELPSVNEQRQIASEITERMSVAHNLRQSLQDQLNSIGRLPAALLREAFDGKL